jgi:hypothetical protein
LIAGNQDEEEEKGCLAFFNKIDDLYIRPFLVYKYTKLGMDLADLRFEDGLDEMKIIEEELIELSKGEIN